MPSIFFLTLLIFTTPSFATTKKARGHVIYWCETDNKICRRVFGNLKQLLYSENNEDARAPESLRGANIIKTCYTLSNCNSTLQNTYNNTTSVGCYGRVNCTKEQNTVKQLCGAENPNKDLDDESRERTCIVGFLSDIENAIDPP